MRDTLVKLRSLVTMKTALINALTSDLEAALRKYEKEKWHRKKLENEVMELKKHINELNWELEATPQEKVREEEWWRQQDQDEDWIKTFHEDDEGVPF